MIVLNNSIFFCFKRNGGRFNSKEPNIFLETEF
jgi:hypothetical protein